MKKTNFTFLKGFVMSMFIALGLTSANAQSVACQDHINASLDAQCRVDLTAIVTAANATSIVVKDGNLTLPQSAPSTYNIAASGVVINKIYTYELWNGLNKCWGTIKFEDKLAPTITCPNNITVACNATYGFTTNEVEIIFSGTAGAGQITSATYLGYHAALQLPTIVECSGWRLFYADMKTLQCGPGTVGSVMRMFRVTDVYGNTASCTQNITIAAPVLPIATPANVTVTDCDVTSLAKYTASKYEPGKTVGGVTIPNVIYPTGDCMINATYTDKVAFDACGAKIVRTWVVVDMCTGQVLLLSGGSPISGVQVITITDNEAPKFTYGPDVTINPNTAMVMGQDTIKKVLEISTSAKDCYSYQEVPFPASTDNCRIVSRTVKVNGITYTANAAGQVQPIGLPMGTHKAVWKIVDYCGNTRTATQMIKVSDLIPPVAVADQNTNVSLTLDCMAVVNAVTFDDGSLDNCCLDVNKFQVKRMTERPGATGLLGNTAFSDRITFDKDDLTKTEGTNNPSDLKSGCKGSIIVIFRVWDCNGNYNDQMVNVVVEDKIGPVAQGKDTMVMCGTMQASTDWLNSWETRFKYLNTLQYPPVFGTNPGYFDNCDATVTWAAPTGSIDQCANGSMQRVATIKDKCDRSATATFTYNSGHQAEFEVTLPRNDKYVCPGSSVPSRADAVSKARASLKVISGCPVVAIDIKNEEIFSAVGGACYRIKRTWVVSSLCHNGMLRGDVGFSDVPVMGGNSDYTYKSRFDGQDPLGKINPNDDKYVEYIQTIDVYDNEKPKINDPQEPKLIADGKCGLKLSVGGFTYDDVCNKLEGKISWALLDANKNALSPAVGGSTFPASHTFTTADYGKKFWLRYRAEDKCGNVEIKDYEVFPKDIIKPTPVCYQGLSIDLMPTTGEAWISATMFDAGSSDGCKVDVRNVALTPAVANPSPATNARMFSADNSVELRIEIAKGTPPVFGSGVPATNMVWVNCVGIVPVRLWAIDAAGNADYCDTYVDVQNNMGANPAGGNCPAVTVVGPKVAGTILASNGKTIENATVTVESSNAANGKLTTKVTNGAYSVFVGEGANVKIGADKNDSPLNGVSTYDLVLISKHILGTQLINGTYELIAADVNNNGKITTSDVVELRKMILGIQNNFNNNKSWRFFDALMNEEVKITNIQADAKINFTGVKVGDINGNANAASAARSTYTFVAEDKTVSAGELVTVALNGTEGFGFTMNYDAKALEVVSIDENSAVIENGTITTAQVGTEFKVTFKANANVTLSEAIAINSNVTTAEAVVNGEAMNATLKFNNKVAGYDLFQNQPNPFRGATMISFNAANAGDYTITITDVAGRTVKSLTGAAVKGLNNVTVEMNNAGVYNYTVTTGNFTATKKMVVIE